MHGADGATAIGRMIADAEKAAALDPQDPESLATLAYARLYQGRYQEAEAAFRTAVDMSPANSHVLILAASGLVYCGKPEEGAGLGDRALRLDPRMTPINLAGVADAYYLARRYEDTIATIGRIPEESRTRGSWLFLAASHARLGQAEEAVAAKAKLLRALPNVSAKLKLNEDYVFARQADEDFFVESFEVLDLPVCLTAAEARRMAVARPLPACEAERAKAAAANTEPVLGAPGRSSESRSRSHAVPLASCRYHLPTSDH